MANTRGVQFIRTDDSTSGVVAFYRRTETDAKKAFIGRVNVNDMLTLGGVSSVTLDNPNVKAVVRAAVHGFTQNILDSSNKLDGEERAKHIAAMCGQVQSGGWASAPVDEAAAKKRAEEAIAKLPPAVREALLKSLSGK